MKIINYICSQNLNTMNKKELLEKLEELNTVPVLRKNMYDEYRQILNDLEQMGVPPLSHTLQNDEDRNVPLTDFPEDQMNVKLRNSLIRNGIKTVVISSSTDDL